jgi:hypothetical protein
MKNSCRTKIILVVLITILNISCQQQTKTGNSSRIIKETSDEVTAYHNAVENMETLKANILKIEDIYDISMENKGSLFDKRESMDATKEIISKSRELLEMASVTLNNEQIITSVSGGRNTVQQYKSFAQKKIEKYE